MAEYFFPVLQFNALLVPGGLCLVFNSVTTQKIMLLVLLCFLKFLSDKWGQRLFVCCYYWRCLPTHSSYIPPCGLLLWFIYFLCISWCLHSFLITIFARHTLGVVIFTAATAVNQFYSLQFRLLCLFYEQTREYGSFTEGKDGITRFDLLCRSVNHNLWLVGFTTALPSILFRKIIYIFLSPSLKNGVI